MGPSSPTERGTAAAAHFSAHVYCGHTAGWIRIPLGMKIGLGSGDDVRWGHSSPTERGQQPPLFGPCLLWPNGRTSRQLLGSCCLSGEMVDRFQKPCDRTYFYSMADLISRPLLFHPHSQKSSLVSHAVMSCFFFYRSL